MTLEGFLIGVVIAALMVTIAETIIRIQQKRRYHTTTADIGEPGPMNKTMSARTRVTMYSYLDRAQFINDTCDPSGQPGYADRLPFLPSGAYILSIAALPYGDDDGFTLIVTWIEPEPPKHLAAIL